MNYLTKRFDQASKVSDNRPTIKEINDIAQAAKYLGSIRTLKVIIHHKD